MTAPWVLPMVVAAMTLTIGSVSAQHQHSKPRQAMFPTRAEAEAAAPEFGCSGAHQMGEMWMVCSKHGVSSPHQGQ